MIALKFWMAKHEKWKLSTREKKKKKVFNVKLELY